MKRYLTHDLPICILCGIIIAVMFFVAI